MAGGDNPGPGRSGNTWARCLVDDIAVFRAKEGPTASSPLLLRVETVLWPTAAKQAGKWYGGNVKVADGFISRWHRVEVENSWLLLAHEDVKEKDEKYQGEGGGGGSHTDTAVDASRK